MSTKDEGLTVSPNDSKPIVSSSAFGHYNDELVFVNDNGEEVCEWCGSTNFQKVDGLENWLCECGSHW
jgi:hypothetical protein